MHDNKLRLSPDVINKAEEIAETWGLKNARAAIEAVFRKYADDYQYGRQPMMAMLANMQLQGVPMGDATPMPAMAAMPQMMSMPQMAMPQPGTMPAMSPEPTAMTEPASCKALDELDDLLGL